MIIKFRPYQESLMVNIDRLRIYQVITNLVNNSLKSLTRNYDQLLTNHIKQIESIIFVSISASNTKVIPNYPEETSDMIDNDFGTVIIESSITDGNSDPNKDHGMERNLKMCDMPLSTLRILVKVSIKE
jgi:signal transduction histidine kinase